MAKCEKRDMVTKLQAIANAKKAEGKFTSNIGLTYITASECDGKHTAEESNDCSITKCIICVRIIRSYFEIC